MAEVNRRPTAFYVIAWSCFLLASLIALSVLYKIAFDVYSRTQCQVDEGDVISYEEKSFKISTRTRVPIYWIRFRVEFP